MNDLIFVSLIYQITHTHKHVHVYLRTIKVVPIIFRNLVNRRPICLTDLTELTRLVWTVKISTRRLGTEGHLCTSNLFNRKTSNHSGDRISTVSTSDVIKTPVLESKFNPFFSKTEMGTKLRSPDTSPICPRIRVGIGWVDHPVPVPYLFPYSPVERSTPD